MHSDADASAARALRTKITRLVFAPRVKMAGGLPRQAVFRAGIVPRRVINDSRDEGLRCQRNDAEPYERAGGLRTDQSTRRVAESPGNEGEIAGMLRECPPVAHATRGSPYMKARQRQRHQNAAVIAQHARTAVRRDTRAPTPNTAHAVVRRAACRRVRPPRAVIPWRA